MMFSYLLNREFKEREEEDMSRQVFLGNFFHCLAFNDFESVLDGFIAVEDGKIVAVGDKFDLWTHQNKNDFIKVQLNDSQFIIPGFVDTHIHAPQVPNLGLGLDKPLMEWLNAYTFPMETQYKDKEFARHVYKKVVQRTLSCGTTTACYFATIHKEACIVLADEINEQGQRAFVGKVCMNQNSPDTYSELLDQSIADNEELIQYINSLKTELITSVITPRFAITCSMEMMKKLANLAQRYNLPIQSHISENLNEIEFTLEIFPGHKNYAEVYDAAGLLTDKCIMAHGVHLQDDEIKLFAKRGTGISHCPNSNTNLKSGMCDVKRLIDGGVKVGLGTDVSGGNRISILDAIRAALDVSHHINFMKKQNVFGTGKVTENVEKNAKYEPLDYKQALFLATLGGAQTMALDEKIGNFLVGKSFDALIIDAYSGAVDKFELPKKLTENSTPENEFQKLLQKFIYSGDDRNIIKVFVNGNEIAGN